MINNKCYILTSHTKQRIRERGININRFVNRDLNFINIRHMITTKEGFQIRYTKNNLKIVLKGNVVKTVFKIRAVDIKKDIAKYKLEQNKK